MATIHGVGQDCECLVKTRIRQQSCETSSRADRRLPEQFSCFLFLTLFMFTDAAENYQCSPWGFVTFKCSRFDAKFKHWEQEVSEPAEVLASSGTTDKTL